VPRRTFQNGKDYGMTMFRRRLKKSLEPTNREVVVKTLALINKMKGKMESFHQERYH